MAPNRFPCLIYSQLVRSLRDFYLHWFCYKVAEVEPIVQGWTGQGAKEPKEKGTRSLSYSAGPLSHPYKQQT